MEFPTTETVDKWDDASLFAAAGFRAAEREGLHGFDALNEVERVLCCLFLLENEVNNGGFGQWLFNCHPRVIGHTAWACETIGAKSTAPLIKVVLDPLAGPLSFPDIDLWRDYLESLSNERHNHFEEYIRPFIEAEPELLACSYRFARQHWADVRV